MATIITRDLDEDLKTQLRALAAHNGHCLEAEIRGILRSVLRQKEPGHAGLGSRIHAHFAQAGGIDLELPDRRMRGRWR